MNPFNFTIHKKSLVKIQLGPRNKNLKAQDFNGQKMKKMNQIKK